MLHLYKKLPGACMDMIDDWEKEENTEWKT
jgi:hypothetical protein